MSALTFDKSELGNLEYSLQREMLATDRIGGYMSTVRGLRPPPRPAPPPAVTTA